MNRLLVIGTMLIIALVIPTQQNAAAPAGTDRDEQGQRGTQDEVPIVGQMLKILTETLDLTAEQQTSITPILQKLHDLQQTLVQDKSLSREERLAKLRPHRHIADEEIRKFLTDNQKGKLDQYLQGPHPEMHGNLNGAPTPIRSN
jgi:hypothetical protein